jgi:hypothetical protein
MKIALIGESSSCNFTAGPASASPEDASHQDASQLSGARDTGKPDKYHCKAQMNMLGKTQHIVGNVSIVTLAAALQERGAANGLVLSGVALGAPVEKAATEEEMSE